MISDLWSATWPALFVLGAVGLYIWYAYRWYKRHPRVVCPACKGTKRVVDADHRFSSCTMCDDDGEVIS